jgi:hypothetical protein
MDQRRVAAVRGGTARERAGNRRADGEDEHRRATQVTMPLHSVDESHEVSFGEMTTPLDPKR